MLTGLITFSQHMKLSVDWFLVSTAAVEKSGCYFEGAPIHLPLDCSKDFLLVFGICSFTIMYSAVNFLIIIFSCLDLIWFLETES